MGGCKGALEEAFFVQSCVQHVLPMHVEELEAEVHMSS
jgi:hypothetical protein